MSTLFISDLHLDDNRPAITSLFQEFLQREASKAEALYILGDLFEYWLGDDAPTPVGREVAKSLLALTRSGVPCYLMHGNRDFLLASDFVRQTGTVLLDEETEIDLYGRRTLLLHGDSLCTDDVEYQQVRALVRNPAWQQDMLSRSPAERLQIALAAREQSAAHQDNVDMEIMDVNPGAVREVFEKHTINHMIHGHTHRPDIHTHETSNGSAERIVLGDWYEQGSVLRVNAEGAKLESLPVK